MPINKFIEPNGLDYIILWREHVAKWSKELICIVYVWTILVTSGFKDYIMLTCIILVGACCQRSGLLQDSDRHLDYFGNKWVQRLQLHHVNMYYFGGSMLSKERITSRFR